MSLRLLAVVLLGIGLVAVLAVIAFVRSRGKDESWPATLRRSIKPLLVLAVGFVLAIQLIPYGRDHDNPPVVAEPPWDSEQTRELAVVACFDCHSNETIWPWYASVAPVSWLVQRDVDRGRSKANWSEWGLDDDDDSAESAETVEEGSMPLNFYTWLHPEAKLSDSELDVLAAGLESTFGRD